MNLQKKRKQSLPSTEPQTAISPSQTPEKLIDTLRRTCKKLPLADFKEAYCNNDLTVLGIGTPEDLQAAWNEILFEYSGLLKSENSDFIFSVSKKIALIHADITFIDGAVMVLRTQHDEDLIAGLRDLGYPLIEGFKEADLDRIVSLSKSMLFDLDDLEKEYATLTKTMNGKKQTEEDFEQTISILSKHQGYQINQQKTMVSEFCGIFNTYLKTASHGRG